MTSQLAYLLLGLGGGAVIAALGLGVVMTYRSAGVINFAHAAVGAFLAFAFFEFRATGDLVLPWFWIPNRFHLLARPTVASALALIVVYGALLGLAIQQLVFRPLRRSPPLASIVGSIGLFLYFWSIIGLAWPTTPTVRPVLPSTNVVIFGRLIGEDRLVLAAIVAVVALTLWLVSRHTRFGLATTAAAENRKGAMLAGLDPNRLAAINSMVATVLAGLAMVGAAQIVSLDPLNNSLLIVPALAAALLGNFTSYPVVALSGFGIGMVQSELLNLQTDLTWLPSIGLQQGVPFLIIVAVIAVRGDGLATRGRLPGRRLPSAPVPTGVVAWSAVLIVGAVVLLLVGGPNWRAALITSSIFAILALSLVIVTGFVGQISLASYAFAGFAAFTMVKLDAAGLPFPLAPLLAAALTCALGAIVGLPAVRVRGLNLAIVTLGAAVAIQELLFKWDWFVGSVAATDVPEPSIGPIDLTIRASGSDYPRVAFGLFCVVTLALCTLLVLNLRRGITGLQWLAVRANEQAAAGAGIDVARAKLTAFALSAFLSGVGGTLLAYQRLTLSADSFSVFNSLSLLALTYLAGIAVVSGGLTAGVLAPVGLLSVAMGQEVGRPSPYQFAVSGLVLVVVAVAYPDGITGGVRTGWLRLRRRLGSRASGSVAATSGTP